MPSSGVWGRCPRPAAHTTRGPHTAKPVPSLHTVPHSPDDFLIRPSRAGLWGAAAPSTGEPFAAPEQARRVGGPGCDLHAVGGPWTELRAPAPAANRGPGPRAGLLLEGGTLQAPTALRKGRGSSRSRWGTCDPCQCACWGGPPSLPEGAEPEAKGRCQVTWMTVTSGRDETPWASRVQGSSHVSGDRLRDLIYPRKRRS